MGCTVWYGAAPGTYCADHRGLLIFEHTSPTRSNLRRFIGGTKLSGQSGQRCKSPIYVPIISHLAAWKKQIKVYCLLSAQMKNAELS